MIKRPKKPDTIVDFKQVAYTEQFAEFCRYGARTPVKDILEFLKKYPSHYVRIADNSLVIQERLTTGGPTSEALAEYEFELGLWKDQERRLLQERLDALEEEA